MTNILIIDKVILIRKFESLSEREKDILAQIVSGKKSKQIAAMQNVSDKTIGTYLIRIRKKTGINSLYNLCFLAGKYDLLQ